MNVRIDTASSTPPVRQIVRGVLDAVAAGVWEAGDRLPSVRGLAADALVNPNTVGKAYRELEHLGVVAGRSGAGVFVTAAGPERARALRREASLGELRRAVEGALASGHDPERLRSEVAQALATSMQPIEPVEGASR